jgi:hypothetical protein
LDVDQKLKYTESLQDNSPDDQDETQDSSTLDKHSVRNDKITDEDLRDMFKVLKRQKEGIEILNGSINESTRQLMVMEREIDLH